MGFWDEPMGTRGMSNRGMLWMDVDLSGADSEDVSYWPTDGAGGKSTTATTQRPMEVVGMSIITVNTTAAAPVKIMAHDGTTTLFTLNAAASGATVGNYFNILCAEDAAHAGASCGGAPAAQFGRGVTVNGFSVQVTTNGGNDGKFRIWYRPE